MVHSEHLYVHSCTQLLLFQCDEMGVDQISARAKYKIAEGHNS